MSYAGINPNKRQDEVKAAVDRRFPEFSCLRCGHGTFGLRLRTDPYLPPNDELGNVADFVCMSCGHIDSYLVANLIVSGEGAND